MNRLNMFKQLNFILALEQLQMVTPMLFLGTNVNRAALWQRRVIFVSSPFHLLRLFSMPEIQFLNPAFKPPCLRMVSVCFVFAKQRANYTVEFRMLTQQVLAVKF